MASDDLIRTGIDGLDAILLGGIPRNNVILVQGPAGFGWNLPELQQQNKLKIVFTTAQVLDRELRSPNSLLLETAVEIGARRLFVDGIGLLSTALAGAS